MNDFGSCTFADNGCFYDNRMFVFFDLSLKSVEYSFFKSFSVFLLEIIVSYFLFCFLVFLYFGRSALLFFSRIYFY